jgi:hypothetical protein
MGIHVMVKRTGATKENWSSDSFCGSRGAGRTPASPALPSERQRSGTLHKVARHEMARMSGLSANIEKRLFGFIENPVAAR